MLFLLCYLVHIAYLLSCSESNNFGLGQSLQLMIHIGTSLTKKSKLNLPININ